MARVGHLKNPRTMAEELENGKHARSQDEPESKKDTGPSLVETAIPIPDFFYGIRATLPLLGSSHGVVRSLTNFLYFITIGIFVATFAYYSLPQHLSEESVVTSEWRKEGHVEQIDVSSPVLNSATNYVYHAPADSNLAQINHFSTVFQGSTLIAIGDSTTRNVLRVLSEWICVKNSSVVKELIQGEITTI